MPTFLVGANPERLRLVALLKQRLHFAQLVRKYEAEKEAAAVALPPPTPAASAPALAGRAARASGRMSSPDARRSTASGRTRGACAGAPATDAQGRVALHHPNAFRLSSAMAAAPAAEEVAVASVIDASKALARVSAGLAKVDASIASLVNTVHFAPRSVSLPPYGPCLSKQTGHHRAQVSSSHGQSSPEIDVRDAGEVGRYTFGEPPRIAVRRRTL